MVAFGKVGIKIVLAVEFGIRCNIAVERKPRNRPKFHVALAHARHSTRKSQTHRTNPRIGHSAVAIFARAKRFCFCKKLRMNLAADNNFIFFYHSSSSYRFLREREALSFTASFVVRQNLVRAAHR